MLESYTYDQRNRLESWTVGGALESYDYDALGNLIERADAPQIFDDPLRPHAIKERTTDGTTYTYQYDDDGNIEARLGGPADQHYTFDSANRPICRGSSPGSCGGATIRYDAYGQRLVQIEASGHEIYVGADFLHRIGSAGSGVAEIQITAFGDRIARKRITNPALRSGHLLPLVDPDWLGPIGLLACLGLTFWGARRGAFVLVVRRPGHAAVAGLAAVSLIVTPKVWAGGGGAPEIYWEIADPLGSGLLLVDEVGDRAQEIAYAPFGEVRHDVGPLGYGALHKMYAGHLYDENAGLVYMNARWYEPGSGRFMNVDPVVAIASDPQSVNAYSYARNNPILYGDPSGMCWTNSQCGSDSTAASDSRPTVIAYYGVVPPESSRDGKLLEYEDFAPRDEITGRPSSELPGQPLLASQGGIDGASAAHDAGGGNWLQRAAGWLGDLIQRDVREIAGASVGAPIGVLAGLWGIGAGIATLNPRTFAIGVFDLAAIAMLRSGSTSGLRWPGPSGGANPFWGIRLPFTGTKLDFASRWHDGFSFGQMARGPGTQVGWITRAWSGSEGGTELRVYGQAYRLYGTAGFGAIAGFQAVGAGVAGVF